MFKVLLVDDEPNILEGLRKIIAWEEYGIEQVLTAYDGESAKILLEENEVHILITDVCMEPITGIELIRYAKEKYPAIKCMVLSGYDSFQYVKEAMSLGIENYLLKPVNQEELVGSLVQAEEKIERERRENLRQIANENVVRNNVLLRWINDSIPERELETKAEALEINIYADIYWVAVFTASSISIKNQTDEDEKYKQMRVVLELLEQKFKQDTYIFQNMDNQVVVIFGGQEEEMYDTIRTQIMRFLDIVKHTKNIQVYAAIGKPVHEYMKVYESYRNALFLIHVNAHAEANTLREWKSEQGEEKKLEDLFSIQVAEITPCIEAMDMEQTELVMKQFVEDVYKSGQNSFIWRTLFLQQLALNIVKPVNFQHNPKLYAKTEEIIYQIHFNQDIAFGEHMNRLKVLAGETIMFLKSRSTNLSPIVREIKEIVDNTYMKELSLNSIADKYKANPVYLGQLFKNEMGEYFSEYLNKVRVEQAKKLLATSKDSAIDIGVEVGCLSKTHFFNIFKKYTGMTPMEYRRHSKM